MKSKLLAEPVLVGRECELEQLHSLLDLAIKGKGNAVFVSGEAGVGKTRLVNEFLTSAKEQGITVLTGWCLSNAAVPYFPFFEAFRKYGSTETQTTNLFKEVSQSQKNSFSQTITPQIWKDQTFTATASTLISISQKQPVILFIDDLHWADSASLALINYLTNIIGTEKILLIATYRIEQLVGDEKGRSHPLLETLRLMKRQDLIKEINIHNLDELSISKLGKSMLGGGIQQEFFQKLTEESQGNPLFVVESIRMLNESKCLIQEDDEWRLTSSAIGIPPKIKDIIMQRLDSLSSTDRNVLEAASVIGEKFDPALLAAMLERDFIDVIKLLDNVSKDSALIRPGEELYRFDHARTRDIVYEEISPALKRGYHARIAEKLENLNKNSNPPFSDIAYHYTEAGNKNKAVQFKLASGQNALSKWSNIEAIKHFSFVIQAVGSNDEYINDRITALEGLGDAYFANDNFAQAIDTFEQVVDIQECKTKLRVLRKAMRSASYLGDISRQKMLIQKAEAIVNDDRLEMGRILYEKGTLAGSENDILATLKLILEALQIFEEEYALLDVASVLKFTGYVAATSGNLETAVVSALRAIAIYKESGDVRSLIEAYSYGGGTFQSCALNQVSNEMLAKSVSLNEQNRLWDFVRIIPAYVWWSIGLMGVDIKDSVSKVLRALEYSEKTDSRLYTGAMYEVLIIAHALSEDQINVDKYFIKLTSLPEQIFSNGVTQIYLGPTMGVYYATKKDFEKSEQCFLQSLAAAKSIMPNPFFEEVTRRLYSWALVKQGKLTEAKEQSEKALQVIETIKEEFSRDNIQSRIVTLAKPEVDKPFPIRLEFVNVSTNQASIVKVGGLSFPGLKIIDVSENCFAKEGHIEFKDNKIGAFDVKTAKITVQATDPGEYSLNPLFTYLNLQGQTKCNKILKVTPKVMFENNKIFVANTLEPVKIVVCPTPLMKSQLKKTEDSKLQFEFETEFARAAFDFLLSSFVQDYMNKRLPLELAGWRTFTDIIRVAGIPKRTVYGVNGLNGRAISELKRRGIAEIRVFPGERGRGGLIQKVRVCYEKEPIARIVDERVTKPVKKQ